MQILRHIHICMYEVQCFALIMMPLCYSRLQNESDLNFLSKIMSQKHHSGKCRHGNIRAKGWYKFLLMICLYISMLASSHVYSSSCGCLSCFIPSGICIYTFFFLYVKLHHTLLFKKFWLGLPLVNLFYIAWPNMLSPIRKKLKLKNSQHLFYV